MQTEEFYLHSFFASGYEIGVTIYLLMCVAALLVFAVVYGRLWHTFIMCYGISQNGLHKGVHGKEQEEKNILFRKWSDKGEAVLRIAILLAVGLILLAFGILLLQGYHPLITQFHNSVPPNFSGNDYALIVPNGVLGACHGKLLLPLCGSCLLQLPAIIKSKRVLYYIFSVSVLFLYGVITLSLTTIVNRFYIKLPLAFAIPAGIGMIM